jgi:predicted nuclease of predicted toxin-antitoxin system
MDFLADENVPRPIIERLRMDGLTGRSIFEESRGIDDTHVLSIAEMAGLILITQDHDFGELAILRQMPVAGVLLLELTRLPLREQIERVATFLSGDPKDLTGNLTVIEPARVRVRALPGARK